MKKAVFPLLCFAFIAACAVFIFMAREAEPVYVNVVANVAGETQTTPSPDSVTPPQEGSPVIININTASLDELMTLHGIGEAIGQRIIDYREESGVFKAIEEIMEVPGVGPSMFGNIKDLITID